MYSSPAHGTGAMDVDSVFVRRNRLLSCASSDDRRLLKPHLEPITLPVKLVLERSDTPIEHLYFMNDGIASVVGGRGGKSRIEVGLVGRESMTGTAVALGDDRSPLSVYIQVAGDGWRIASATLRSAMKASGSLSGPR